LLHSLQIGGLPFVQHFSVAGNQLGPRPAGNGLQEHAGFGFGQRGVLQEGFGLHGAIFRRDVFRRPFIANPTKNASYRYSRTGGHGNGWVFLIGIDYVWLRRLSGSLDKRPSENAGTG
jgi:hypothetical protein